MYQVYEYNQRRGLILKYEGDDLDAALEAYNRLIARRRPRFFRENGQNTMYW